MSKLKAKINKLPAKTIILIVLALFVSVATISTVVLANQNTVVVEASILNVRTGPGLSYDVMDQVTSGQRLDVIEENNGWYKIRLDNDQIGWVAGWLVNFDEANTENRTIGTISGEYANIRSGPSTDHEVIGQAYQGTDFTIVYQENDWVQVEYGGTLAWINASLISNTETAAPATPLTNLAQATIVLDAGHGGSDPGAVSSEDVYEKDVAYATTMKLYNRLKDSGANVILTRDGDYDVSLADRAYLSNANSSDLFISLHYDSNHTKNSSSGTTTYYYKAEDYQLAETINQALATYGSLPNNGIREGNFQVLRDNYQPALLVELGYMNNDYDASLIQTDWYQAQVAEAIYQGILEHFNG